LTIKIITSQLEPINDPKLAQLCRISLVLLAVLIVGEIVTVFAGLQINFKVDLYCASGRAAACSFQARRD